MRRLAADIADTGTVFEPPLVRQEAVGYVVYDGNRRVASLKLLSNPGRAHSETWTNFYSGLKGKLGAQLPTDLECRLEQDGDVIDELLYRRHTGTQGGVGQSPWDATAKHNFVERTGRGRSINIARQLVGAMHKFGYTRSVSQIPISNMNRLLSGESQRNRVGLRLRKDSLSFTHEPAACLRALQRITEDLATRKVVLAHVWDAESKDRYLQRLEGEGVLPNVKFALKTPVPLQDWVSGTGDAEEEASVGEGAADPVSANESGETPDLPRPSTRVNLIPADVNFNLPTRPELTRIRAIWDELQFKLKLKQHPNAISVLFRVLLEFSIDYYLNSVRSTKYANAGWSDKLKAAISHQRESGLIDSEYLEIVQRFQRREELLSSASMNKYVHSADLAPSTQHLCSLWDTLQRFVVQCVRA